MTLSETPTAIFWSCITLLIIIVIISIMILKKTHNLLTFIDVFCWLVTEQLKCLNVFSYIYFFQSHSWWHPRQRYFLWSIPGGKWLWVIYVLIYSSRNIRNEIFGLFFHIAHFLFVHFFFRELHDQGNWNQTVTFSLMNIGRRFHFSSNVLPAADRKNCQWWLLFQLWILWAAAVPPQWHPEFRGRLESVRKEDLS